MSNVSINPEVKTSTNEELKSILNYALGALASAKTARYFMGKDGLPDQSRLNGVVNTIEAIRATEGKTIKVGEDFFPVEEYKIPNALVDYVRAGITYASADAVGKCEPIFKAQAGVAVLSPIAFNKFFDDFNINQPEEYQVPTTGGWRGEPVTLENVQYLENESGDLCMLHNGGFGIETCALLHFKVPALTACMPSYTRPTMEGFKIWLSKQS